MGGLSMKPDGDVQGSKLARRVAENEATEVRIAPEARVKEKKESKMKLGPFEFDTTYPRTIPGFVRIVQVLTLIVALVCLIIASNWPDKGTYTFYCLFLVFGILISGYLLFTVMASSRGKTFLFGLSWITTELIYFALFGLLIFIGACLAASKSAGNAGLNASSAFGFISIITFAYYFWITWKLRGSEEEEDVKVEDKNEVESGRKSVASSGSRNVEENEERRPESQHSIRRFPSVSSLPPHLTDQIYENGNNPPQDTVSFHQRPHSASEKDSAYSEGELTPTRGKVIPPKMRRTGSGYGMDHPEMSNVLHRQPLSHMTHRYGRSGENRNAYGYPRELATSSFVNQGFQPNVSRFETDDLHRSRGGKKSMPDWLRAALGEEVGQDNMEDEESQDFGPPHMTRNATMPSIKQKEFPLLNTSDEESICYPSISQNGGLISREAFRSRQHQTLPHGKRRRRRSTGTGIKSHHSHHHGHHQHQRHHRHGSKRSSHHHGRRRHHEHHHHHRGRHPPNGAHEDYLRKVMGNDELVMRGGHDPHDLRRDDKLPGFQPHQGKPIETGKRRVIPEQPISIQFPEHSRWEDEGMMEKYFSGHQRD
nr:uncharacterized protein LOC100185716 [Ciona intestinalis]|eukprot:XP_002122775.1 uncharacterized protein LOC100185716 [Ciona intestinalis]